MPQMNWTYVGDSGTPYKVTLYHGPQSGHVLVVVNGKVSIIDFFVRESRNYSLMLEDELMVVEIEKGVDGYSYGFVIDEDADTQRNRDRRRVALRRNGWIALSALLGLGLFLWLVLVLFHRQEARMAREAMPWLEERGMVTLARLGQGKEGEPLWYYAVRKQVFTLPGTDWPDTLPPPRSGDDVLVYFLPRKPTVARLDPSRPGPRRSLRLQSAWWTGQHEGRWSREWLDECLLPAVRADSILMGHAQAPWHRRTAPALDDWLETQPDLIRRVGMVCR